MREKQDDWKSMVTRSSKRIGLGEVKASDL